MKRKRLIFSENFNYWRLSAMKKYTGIWIDHREAILVALEGEGCTVEKIESNADSKLKPSGGWKAGGTIVAQAVTKERTAEEIRKHQYQAFYNEVIKQLANPDALVIFGPGEAKIEFAHQLEKSPGLHKKVAAIEKSERLTDNQVIAWVKAFFSDNR